MQELPKDGPIQPTASDKLQLYGWYKTATVGAVDRAQPGLLDLEGKDKWNAWNEAQTTPAGDCKKAYVNKLIEILEQTDGEEAKKYLAELK